MEKSKVVDKKGGLAALDFVAEHARLFSRQGVVVEAWRDYRGRRLGPYFRLAFRDQGKQRSLSLGSDRELAEEVRRALSELQAPLCQRRAARKRHARVRAGLRRAKAEWNRELEKSGLYLQGYEVRGWRGPRRRPKLDTLA